MTPSQPTHCNRHRPLLIGITGGIGSGKSVVSHILRIAGLPVYDTDSEAKRIMDSPVVKNQIIATWGTTLYQADGSLDRRKLANIVFNNPEQLTTLNNIVHPAGRNAARPLLRCGNDRLVDGTRVQTAHRRGNHSGSG